MTRCPCIGGPLDATTENGFGMLGCVKHDRWERVLPHHPTEAERISFEPQKLNCDTARLSQEEMLEKLRSYAAELGRSPKAEEMSRVRRPQGLPSRHSYATRFGSWVDALLQAGLKPRPGKTGMRAA